MEDLCFNGRVGLALENKYGFSVCDLVPREVVALYRAEARVRIPELLESQECLQSEIENLIADVGWDEATLSRVTPTYSARFEENGHLSVYIGEKPLSRRGDITVEAEKLDVFMETVMHIDWRQELTSSEFTFNRALLVYLPDDFHYSPFSLR